MVPTNFDLNWSFQPISVWLHLTTGINLWSSRISESKKKKCYQLFCLLFNVVIQLFVTWHMFHNLKSVTKSSTVCESVTETQMWNTVIDYLNYAAVPVSAHLILLTVIQPRWIFVINSIQHFINLFDLSFYVKLRRLSFLGIAYVILLVSDIYRRGLLT